MLLSYEELNSPPKTKNQIKFEIPEEIEAEYKRKAMFATAGTSSALALASMVPNSAMMSTFALSCWVGNSCVQGVSHALHSPLMAMTNAISGMTIVGGMLQLNGGIMPTNTAQWLAAGAVGLSAVNLVGGTIVTKKMLDMFRRPDDPPEFNHYYLLFVYHNCHLYYVFLSNNYVIRVTKNDQLDCLLLSIFS